MSPKGKTDKRKKCYHCIHAGKRFLLSNGPHCHCEHPREAGKHGWDTVRFVFSSCPEFKPLKKDVK